MGVNQLEINTQFYTTTQEDVPNTYGVKRFAKTYKAMLNDGDLPFNEPFDVSISPYAMAATADGYSNYDNDIKNKCWCFPNIDGLDTTTNNPENVKRDYLYNDDQTFFPFLVQWGEGGSGIGYGYANYTSRNAYSQTALNDTSNVKTNNYIATDYKYNRFAYAIEIFVSDYGHNNSGLTEYNLYNGSWWSVADISDTVYNDIISGTKDINGVRFIPFYSATENAPNDHGVVDSMQFKPLCTFNTLDDSVYGVTAPYTVDYLDYMINSYSGIGSFNGIQGYTTTALGHIALYNNYFPTKYRSGEWSWDLYPSLSDWCETNFTDNTNYEKFGTLSEYWKNTALNVNSYQYIAFRQYLNTTLLDTKEKILDYLCTQCAYLGTYFVLSTTAIRRNFPLNSSNPDCYLGCIESDGLTHGRYVKGADIANEPYGDDIDDIRTAVDWTPPVPDPDPNEYDDNNETILNNVKISPEFCTRYALTRTQLKHAHNFLCTQIATDTDSEYWSMQKLYVNNPLDVVQSVMLFPFDISNFQTDEPSYEELTFGQLVDSGYNVQINREQYCVINMGECVYYPTFGNSVDDFRNYPPYSSATLYIPYCGSVEIDPNLYMGHTIGVKIIVDMATGGCLALILRDKLVVDSISGTMGVTIPISGIQTQTLAAAERQAESQLKTARNSAIKQFAKGVGSIVAAPVAGGVVGAVAMTAYQTTVGDITQAKDTITKAQFNLEHINVPYKTIGTATSTTSFANERKCRLIVRRPVMMNFDSEKYAHNTGYACLKTGVVSDFTGYTEFQTVDLSGISATSQEKTQLFKLLQGGVFL